MAKRITEVGFSQKGIEMAKYYVESGTLQMVTDADDARGAALWAVHRCMEQVLPICPDDPLTPQEKRDRVQQRGCDVLGETIRTNEVGFEREDVQCFDATEIFVEWNQLLSAMSRLQRDLQQVCPA
jgi:hypothetical protein